MPRRTTQYPVVLDFRYANFATTVHFYTNKRTLIHCLLGYTTPISKPEVSAPISCWVTSDPAKHPFSTAKHVV